MSDIVRISPPVYYAGEKLTVSNSVVPLTATAYTPYYGDTRVTVDNPDGTAFQRGEWVVDGTSFATGRIVDFDSATAATYLDLYIFSGTFGDNNQITGQTSGATCDVNGTYTRGGLNRCKKDWKPQYARIYVDCAGIRFTRNGSHPYYHATEANCIGEQAAANSTIELHGLNEIKHFRAIRDGGTDAKLMVEYAF